MANNAISAITSVEHWIGNPVSLALLNFVATEDACGNRLSNAIDMYLGADDSKLCWRCKLAGKIVGYTLDRGSDLFGIGAEELRGSLADPVVKRGLMNVLNGIARYGITRPQRVNAPFLVVWDFTHMCNLKCSHCYQDAQKPLPGELTTEEAKKVIDELAAAGVVVVAFSGGESLMRKDFFEVAAYAHAKGMYVALASNGTMISEDVAQCIHDAGIDYVEISIDGKDAEQHDGMRGIAGAYERSIEGIRNCAAIGIFTCIAVTVTSGNCDQVPEIYRKGKDLGVNRVMCFNFIPTGRGIEMADKDITPLQREELLKFILQKNGHGAKTDILSTAPQFARVALEDGIYDGVPVGHFHHGIGISGQTKMLADFIGGCGAGRLYCSIEPTGDVQPCVFLPITIGNVKDQAFLDIWHNSPVLGQLRDRSNLEGQCGTCEYNLVCGGCRARAWAYFRNLKAPDPGCVNNISLWNSLCNSTIASPCRVPADACAGAYEYH